MKLFIRMCARLLLRLIVIFIPIWLFDHLINPALVEILSASARALDRGSKFATYRSIPALREYLLVSLQTMLAEHYRRQQPNERKLLIYQQATDTFALLEEEVILPVHDLYRNTNRYLLGLSCSPSEKSWLIFIFNMADSHLCSNLHTSRSNLLGKYRLHFFVFQRFVDHFFNTQPLEPLRIFWIIRTGEHH